MIDSHCHLADDSFKEDAAAVIARAAAAGISGALCILDAANPDERARAPMLSAGWAALRFCAGIHPHAAGPWKNRIAEAVSLVDGALRAVPRASAVGEIGLDYHYDFSPPDVQQDVFEAQVELARARSVPIVVHAREADDDTLAILRRAGDHRVSGVMHCFTGTVEFARAALDLGLLVSVAGIVTFPRATNVHEVARFVPADRLLIETDSPFLAPVPYRGRRNEPAWVVQVAQRVADLRRTSLEDIAAVTSANFERVFGRLREDVPEHIDAQGLAR